MRRHFQKKPIPREWDAYTTQFRQSMEIAPAMFYDTRVIHPGDAGCEFFRPGRNPNMYWDRERADRSTFDYYNPLLNPQAFLIERIWISGLERSLLSGAFVFDIGHKRYITENLFAASREMMVVLSPMLMIKPLQSYRMCLTFDECADGGAQREEDTEIQITMVGQCARPIQ